jgi:hypothetical protein
MDKNKKTFFIHKVFIHLNIKMIQARDKNNAFRIEIPLIIHDVSFK